MDAILYSEFKWLDFHELINYFFGFDFESIDDLINKIEIHNGKIEWHSLKEWEELDDIAIYSALESIEKPEGEIFIITEMSYFNKSGPFKLKAVDIRQFIVQYFNRFHECFFNGDLLMFNIEHQLIWIFHHEGVYAFVKLNSNVN
jgi:hypothetical protein